MQRSEFAGAILNRIHAISQHESRVHFLLSWMQREEQPGQGAACNPLNTTQQMPGSTFFNYLNAEHTEGVQNYVDAAQGIDATVKTLENGYYPGILAFLQGRTSSAPDHEFETWSGNGYSFSAILATPVVDGFIPGTVEEEIVTDADIQKVVDRINHTFVIKGQQTLDGSLQHIAEALDRLVNKLGA